MTCEICTEPYRVTLEHRFSCTFSKVCACRPMGYVLEAAMLLFCLTCTVVMMLLVGPSLGDGESSSKLTVWTLFGITVLMALVALKKIIGR